MAASTRLTLDPCIVRESEIESELLSQTAMRIHHPKSDGAGCDATFPNNLDCS